jgi:citrate lyase beta subunit
MTLSPQVRRILGRARAAELQIASDYPGDPVERRPVHVVYGGAHLFRADTSAKLGRIALDALRRWMPHPAALARCFGIKDDRIAESVYDRVVHKLEREPVEDFRADFEDGYGCRTDDEEDAHAAQCADEMARGLADAALPPFIGIRIKPLNSALATRAAMTLQIFTNRLLEQAGRLPDGFVITLPKVVCPEQVEALAELLSIIESGNRLAPRSIRMELMFESPRVLVDAQGRCAVPSLIRAAAGRCRGIHFGPYDYTASLNITAAAAGLSHPACEFARRLLQAAAAGSGVTISDGPTAIMPLPLHRGDSLTAAQIDENTAAVRSALSLHFDNVTRALHDGIYQGWDLHPAQLPARYAAVYAFFLAGADAAARRLRAFIDQAMRASVAGNVFDDSASAQTLVNFFRQGRACGALADADAEAAGLTAADLDERSFQNIIERRRIAG